MIQHIKKLAEQAVNNVRIRKLVENSLESLWGTWADEHGCNGGAMTSYATHREASDIVDEAMSPDVHEKIKMAEEISAYNGVSDDKNPLKLASQPQVQGEGPLPKTLDELTACKA